MRLTTLFLFAALLLIALPAQAQDKQIGQVAGKAGERLTREQAGTGIEPMARIDNRIQNRVQSRIRNRIDRYYNEQALEIAPFDIMRKKVKAASQPIQR